MILVIIDVLGAQVQDLGLRPYDVRLLGVVVGT